MPFLIFLVAISFTNSVSAQLGAGTYYIGPADSIRADYNTFAEVRDTLNSTQGIVGDGPVIFEILPGEYDVHITLNSITNASETSPVIFTCASTTDSSQVTLTYDHPADGSHNYMITLNGTSWVTFKNLTIYGASTVYTSRYGKVFILNNGTSNITFQNNVITGKPYNNGWYDQTELIVSTSDALVEDILVEHNVFNSGEVAVDLNGPSGRSQGNIIRGNTMSGQWDRGIKAYDQEDLIIHNNTVRFTGYDRIGIDLIRCDQDLRVTRNHVWCKRSNVGIYIYNCDGETTTGLVASNFVHMYDNERGTNYGIHLRTSTKQKIYHNTVKVSYQTRTSSRCLYVEGGSGHDVRNNIFANWSKGYAFYTSSTSAFSAGINNNNYYTNGNFLNYWGGAQNNLSEYKTANTNDTESVSVNPAFLQADPEADLHTTTFLLFGKGADLRADALYDIDGEERLSATPCIGADEYTSFTGAAITGTIDIGASEDISSLDHLVDSMRLYGISGPVTINLRDDKTYDERIHFSEITGADQDKRITIQSHPDNSSQAIILSGAASESSNYIFLLRRGSYITLKNLTISSSNASYPTVLLFDSYCVHDSILDCTFNTSGTTSGTAIIRMHEDEIHDITVKGNTIAGGIEGIRLYGYNSTSRYPQNVLIEDNTFSNQHNYGVYLFRCNAPVIRNNYFESSSASSYYKKNVLLEDCPNGVEVTNNEIIGRNYGYGIYLDNCDGSFGNESLIANNTVTFTAGGDIIGGLSTHNSDFVHIFYNSFRITENNGHAQSRCYYNTGGQKIKVKNNIMAMFGLGYAIWNNSGTAIDTSDNNILFTSGKYIARWGSDERTTLKSWQSVSGLDAQSIEANPAYVSSENLQARSPFLDNKAAPIPGLATDLEGNPRSGSSPDIGAYEFTSPWTPMEGSYTVFGADPDFPDLSSAFDSLQLKGVGGPVEFILRAGTHEDAVNTIRPVGGLTAKDSLLIRGETGDREDVQVFTSENSTILPFRRGQNITVRDLTLNCTNTEGGRSVGFWSNTNNIRIINNRLLSANTANAVLWIGDNAYNDSIFILNNLFSKGEYSIYLNGVSSSPGTNTYIKGNRISGSSNTGIYVKEFSQPIVNNNTLSNLVYIWTGIRLDDSPGPLQVVGNRIDNDNRGTGIYLEDCHATEEFAGLVANNMIRVGGTYDAYGINLNSSEYQNIFHNSVNITSTNADNSYGLYLNSTNLGIQILNNIFANNGAGRALRVDDDDNGDILDINYNSYFSKSETRFARWDNVECADLAALKAENGLDANSLEIDPKYISKTELYSGQVAYHQKATPLAEVPYDIDSVPRDASKPDIGAAEFYCETPVFNVYAMPTCSGDSTILIDSTTNVAAGSARMWDFNNDGIPEKFTENIYDTVVWKFDDTGVNFVNFRIQQIAGCDNNVNVGAVVVASPELELARKGAYCDTNDGWASVVVTNDDSGPYVYLWSDGQTDSLATGLALGTYSVSVLDKYGCSSNGEVVIGEAIEVTVTQIKESDCGIPDGIAAVSATGGFGPYDFVWSNGVNADTNKTLSPGSHYVNVIDSKGCYVQGSINIESDGGPEIALVPATSVSSIDCYGERSGKLDISITSGVTPYKILWSNGATTEDIDSLAAGIYDVTVTDADGCIGAASFQVVQPAQISISPVVSPSTCNGADGSAVAVVSGGFKPYVYSWSSGGIFQIEEGLEAGVYSVTVTDAKGCKMVAPVLVNNVGAPVVNITNVTGTGCTVFDNGAIDITAVPFSTLYTYDWETEGGSGLVPGNEDQSGLTPGLYKVTVTDPAGCKGVNRAVVAQEPPEVNPICMVTVDTAIGKNVVVWEKQVTEDVSHYNVYRESSVRGNYQLVASVPFDEESIFIDSIADPTVRSWRYKLSVVDDCGNESELSEHHKTMHLTMNVGLDESVNLIWDHYEGFDIPTYEVFRYDSAGGWTRIADLPSNLTSYTDQNPPTQDLTYFIEVDHPTGCTTDDKKASTYNSSRSNRKNKLKAGSGPSGTIDLMNVRNFQVYPNPGTGLFNMRMDLEEMDDVSVKVFDVSGKLVMTKEFFNVPFMLEEQIDLTEYSNGIYQIHVKTSKTLIHRILIKE